MQGPSLESSLADDDPYTVMLLLLLLLLLVLLEVREIDDLWRPMLAEHSAGVLSISGGNRRQPSMVEHGRSTEYTTSTTRKTRGTVGTVSLRCKGHFGNLPGVNRYRGHILFYDSIPL